MNRLLAIALLGLPLWAQGGVIVGGSQLLGTSDLGDAWNTGWATAA